MTSVPGESAADAYDRVSGFNETLWRQFAEDDFASVCVLVTHGLMTRVFLMKWYHWSVEYFEDLRNVNHCEFVIMNRSRDSGKFILENQLRTWSELKRQRAAEAKAAEDGATEGDQKLDSPEIPPRKGWGSVVSTSPLRRSVLNASQLPSQTGGPTTLDGSAAKSSANEADLDNAYNGAEDDDEAFPSPKHKSQDDEDVTMSPDALSKRLKVAQMQHDGSQHNFPSYLEVGRDFGGTRSGTSTPMEGVGQNEKGGNGYGFPLAKEESKKGMDSGARADPLGDRSDGEERGR